VAKKKRTAKKQTLAATSASEQIDHDQALSALIKKRAGDKIPRDELSALKRVEKAIEDEARWRHYGEMPKRDYLEAAGRQTVQVHKHADRYGVPVRGRSVDLVALIAWLHQFLDDNGEALDAAKDGRQPSPELERLRAEQRKKVEIANRKAMGELRSIDEVYATYNYVADVMRKATEDIRKTYGDGPADLIREAIERGRLALQRMTDSDQANANTNNEGHDDAEQ